MPVAKTKAKSIAAKPVAKAKTVRAVASRGNTRVAVTHDHIGLNDTKHLMSSPANAKRLTESMAQLAPNATVRDISNKDFATIPTELPAEVRRRIIRSNISLPGDIEDAFRQTGRTSEMIKAAAEKARQGVEVIIVVKDDAAVKRILEKACFYPQTTVRVVAHDPKGPEFEWESVMDGSIVNSRIFVDHAVVYEYLKNAMVLLDWRKQPQEELGASNAG